MSEKFYSATDAATVSRETVPARRGRPPKPAASAPAPELEALPVSDDEEAPTADAAIVEEVDERVILKRDIERIRALRKPFGAFTQKLALPERAGYHRHWFNDAPGRVDEAVANGWAHIKDKEGKPVSRIVGRGRDNGALKAYAMELPKVFWEEDMRARAEAAQARVDDIKKAPFRAKSGQSAKADQGKFYSPKEDVVSVREDRASGSPLGGR